MRRSAGFLVLMLSATGLLVGCSSDSTAPNESLPPLSKDAVAGQTGFLTVAMIQVAPLALNFSGKAAADGQYVFTFAPGDPVQGSVHLEFRLGGAAGSLVEYSMADWARVFTAEGEPLLVELIEGGIPWILNFDLINVIDRDPDTATIGGAGSLLIGNYVAIWLVDGLLVYSTETSEWPGGGTLTFANGGHTAVVTFDGDHLVTIDVGGELYDLNLNSGAVTPQ